MATDAQRKRSRTIIADRRNDGQDGDCHPATDADMESDSCNAALRANEAPTFVAPCRITFNHTRKRLADIDGLSGKAVIDGIVQAGILADDTAKQIAEIRNRQTKGSPEETVIVIESIKKDVIIQETGAETPASLTPQTEKEFKDV